MKTTVLIGLSFSLLISVPNVMTAQNPSIPLHIADTVRVLSTNPDFFAMLPARPGNGGFYTRFFSAQGMEPNVRWVSVNGEKTVLFQVDSIPVENSNSHIAVLDFTPMPDGGMAALVRWQKPGSSDLFTIAEFENDGKYKNTVHLNLNFSPNRLAVFNSGELFLSGGTQVPYGWKNTSQAIANTSGQIVQQINLPLSTPMSKEWSGPQQTANGNQQKYADGGKDLQTQIADSSEAKLANAAERSSALSGDDGYVYFTWPIDQNVVYRISDKGNVKNIRLMPAVEQNGKQKLLYVQESHGNLVVNSGVLGRTLQNGFSVSSYNLQVYDASQGMLLANYTTEEPIGFGLIYFEPGNFYFLKKTTSPRGFSILHAVPK